MAKYNTRQGITWSDEGGGFQAEDIIKMYQAHQQSKLANAANLRAEKALEMQQEKVDYAKDINNKIIKGQQAYSDMIVDLTKSGWNEDGVWDADNVNINERASGYMQQMKDYGLAGDASQTINDLTAMNTRKLTIGGAQLQAKVQAWEEANKDKKGKWYIPGDDSFNEDRKAYIKSIGGDKIYRQAFGLGGEAGGEGMALQLTGLSKDDFDVDDSWSAWEKGIAGAGTVAGGTLLYNKAGAIKDAISKFGSKPAEAIKDLKRLSNMDDALKPVYNQIVSLQKEGKKTQVARLLKRFGDRLPELSPEAKPPKTPAGILSKMKKLIPFSAPIIGIGVDEAMGIEAPVAETAGTAIMGYSQKKPFLQFLGSKLPARVAPKALALAAADGPLPWGELLGLGFTGVEAYRLYNEWKNLSNK